jgi:hypothetical protein
MLTDVDPKTIHQQIMQLEHIHHDMLPDNSVEANTLAATLKLLHQIEEEIRHKARVEHHH